MRALPLLLVLVTGLPASAFAGTPLLFHYPDSGAPPYLYISPGASQPGGIVADILAAAARSADRTVQYESAPREGAARTTAGGAFFFTVTRAAPSGMRVSEPLLRMDSVLVTPRAKPVGYARPTQLADKRLCTLTDETYPPLALLDMSGKLLQRKAKTEQAQLMMLRNEDCAAAVINGPMYRWLADRYHWTNLRIELQRIVERHLPGAGNLSMR